MKKRLGDEVQRLEAELTEKERQIFELNAKINVQQEVIIETRAEVRLAKARERLKVIQEISGRGEGE